MNSTFKNDETGLSEIIGALMLTLVVVIAATAYATFVSQQQKVLQKQQADNLRRSGEKISILDIKPTIDATGTHWDTLDITIASLHSDTSVVSSLRINDLFVKHGWYQPTSGHAIEYTSPDTIQLLGMDRIVFTIRLTDPLNDLFGGPLTVLLTDFVKVDVFTQYQNDFTQIFIPPTAIILVTTETQWDQTLNAGAGGYKSVIILDGSRSDQPGNGTIIKWSWDVQDTNIVGDDHKYTGRMIVADTITPHAAPGHIYQISLTVQDDNGMLGMSQTTYTY